jgi:hypothetical protein
VRLARNHISTGRISQCAAFFLVVFGKSTSGVATLTNAIQSEDNTGNVGVILHAFLR